METFDELQTIWNKQPNNVGKTSAEELMKKGEAHIRKVRAGHWHYRDYFCFGYCIDWLFFLDEGISNEWFSDRTDLNDCGDDCASDFGMGECQSI